MSTAELAIPKRELLLPIIGIERQVDPLAWFENLRLGIRTPAQIKEEITHLFAEYSVLAAEVVPWHFSLPKDKQYMLDSFCGRGIRAGSERSRLEIEEGFRPLLNSIEEVEEDSIGLWPYPPGSAADGFDENYGFGYLYDIKTRFDGTGKDVDAYALRLEPFNEEVISGLLKLLSSFGLLKNLKPTKKETLLTNPVVFSLGQEIFIPAKDSNHFKYPIYSISDLVLAIDQHIPGILKKERVIEGLSGAILDEVKLKFREQINRLFNLVWVQARGLQDFDFGIMRARDLLLENFAHVQAGSCPASFSSAASTEPKAGSEEKQDKWNYCGVCNMWYQGSVCPYCQGWN